MAALSESLIKQLEDLKIKLQTVETALKEQEERKYKIQKNISIAKLQNRINSLSILLDYKYKNSSSIREDLIFIKNTRKTKNKNIIDNKLNKKPLLPQIDEFNLLNEEIFFELLDIINKQHHRISVLEAILS